ncbi:MAG TPA: thymidine phosphorylase, partial [Candidatus Mediterraneibacter colneyensis]|nr:thymidine phosphorylase [Candidatus Mediterraneibacter colneyensis]
ADKKLYALRDVTGTVDQMSLIASSIMSKKLASGADAIVLDVKTGDGAFMKKFEDARALATEMVSIGRLAGKDVSAVISDMDQPLGYAVGNALEVKEAVETLKGRGPADLRELVLVLGSLMAVKAGKAENTCAARTMLEDALDGGKAFAKFRQFIGAQGGDPKEADNTELLPQAEYQESVPSDREGYVKDIHTEEIGRICLLLGGGRETKESGIDLSVGIVLNKKKGERVGKGEPLAVIHANDKTLLKQAKERLRNAYVFAEAPCETAPLIREVIG